MTFPDQVAHAIKTKLRCPYCKTPFKKIFRQKIIKKKLYGYVQCACDEFPIVHNIVYLKKDIYLKNKQAVFEIKNNNYLYATRLLIDGYSSLEKRCLRMLFLYNLITAKRIFFILRMLKYINPPYKAWYAYITNRRKRISYILSLSHAHFCRKNSTVLDIGCGFSFFLDDIHRYQKTERLYGIDESFSMLLLSSVYFSHLDIVSICQDINYGLPFIGNSVDTIFVSDTYMYVYNKQVLMEDVSAVINARGVGVFCHVHNKNADNFAAGYGVTPGEMQKYTKQISIRGISDTWMYHAILYRKAISYRPLRALDKHASSYSFLLTKQHDKHEFMPPNFLYDTHSLLENLDATTEVLHL